MYHLYFNGCEYVSAKSMSEARTIVIDYLIDDVGLCSSIEELQEDYPDSLIFEEILDNKLLKCYNEDTGEYDEWPAKKFTEDCKDKVVFSTEW